MNKYRLHPKASNAVMDDESGIALYSECSGRSAFLKNQHQKLAIEMVSNKLLDTFSSIDMQSWLNIDNEELYKLENWLVENKFIVKHS
ncbi:MAG: hypothetical protein ABJK37_06365 [Paraglaciecola sp.]|uniref:hypothetical protein n=1 Tax=Paraglaciecola sp. TaxID=1920173 RepID=UPI003298FEC4